MKSIKVYLADELYQAINSLAESSGQSKSAQAERLLYAAIYQQRNSEELRTIHAEIQVILRTIASIYLITKRGLSAADEDQISEKIDAVFQRLLERARDL
jgi:hypothetical protein